MRVILVRHGKTALGARYRFQSANTPLSPKGVTQAITCARELAHERITKVYTSSYERAVETAQHIAKEHHVIPEEHAFFTEKFNSSTVIGRSYFSLPFIMLALATVAHLFVRRVRYQNEETFDELSQRVAKARVFLEEHATRDEGVVVVSHAFWIAAFLASADTVRPRSVRLIRAVLHAFVMRNTQHFILGYDVVTKHWSRIN